MVNKVNRNKAEKKGSGFKYQYRSAEKVKEHAERSLSTFDSIIKRGFDQFRAKQGDNQIRILPPTWESMDHFGLRIYIHSYVGDGSYLCLYKMKGKPCAICDAAKEAKDAGEDDEHKALRFKEYFLYWILDRNGDDPTVPQVWQQSAMADQDLVALTQGRGKKSAGVLPIDHPDEGFDLSFRRKGQGKTGTKYFGQQFDRDPSPISDDATDYDEIMDFIMANPLPSILQYYNNDHLKKVISGSAEKSDEDLDDDEDDKKPNKRGGAEAEGEDEEIEQDRKARAKRRRDDEDEDESEDDDVADEKPSRSSSRKVSRDESEDDDEPPPRRKGRQAEESDDAGDEDDDDRRSRKRISRDDDEEDNGDSRPSRRTKPSRGRDSEDEDTEDEPPRRTKPAREKLKSRASRDEEEEDRPRGRRSSRSRDEDEEDD